MTWEEYQQIKTLLIQWDLDDEWSYLSDKLDKNEIDNYHY